MCSILPEMRHWSSRRESTADCLSKAFWPRVGIAVTLSIGLAGCRGAPGGASPAASPTKTAAPPAAAAVFVGRAVCEKCHAEEARRWAGSHHDLAMQPADETTVLG